MGVKVSYKGNQIASMDGNGTKTLNTAGKYCEDNVVVQYEKPTASEVTSGTKDITANGNHDVTAYKTANVNVPIPSGYIKPSDTKAITSNGTHDVTSYANAEVNVPTGVQVSGIKSITANGEYDVSTYEKANVNVPIPSGYIKPSGSKSITTNGEHDVSAYEKANVNVPIPSGYIKPSGTKTVTENGTHDVTSYASVEVNVASGGTTATRGKVFEKVIAAGDVVSTYAWVTLVDADADILAHKDDATLAVSFYRTTTVEGACILGGIQRSNALAHDGKTGTYFRQTSASAGSPQSLTAGLRAGTASTGVMHVTDAGEVKIYQASSYKMLAGTYIVSVTW